MDSQNLETFLAVAKLGSFNKAAEQQFISPTAVMKQINKLENEMDSQLIERTRQGIHLTVEGETFLTYAQDILKLTQEAYLACQRQKEDVISLKLGSSLIHPSHPFVAIWNRIKQELTHYQLSIVPIPQDLTSHNREYEAIGKDCDLMIGTFDEATTDQLVDALPLGAYRFSLALPFGHPLTDKDILTFDDLEGLSLMMVPRGISQKNDALRTSLEKHVKDLTILETKGRYDLETFNYAADKGLALINLTPWEDLHPSLVSIPLDTDITVDYGILTSKQAPTNIKNFLKAVHFHILTQMGEGGPIEK